MKIVINVHGRGRPSGANKANTIIRNAYIVRAYNNGFRRRVIAEMYGLSYNTVCKAIKDVK